MRQVVGDFLEHVEAVVTTRLSPVIFDGGDAGCNRSGKRTAYSNEMKTPANLLNAGRIQHPARDSAIHIKVATPVYYLWHLRAAVLLCNRLNAWTRD
ncbi:hypothetical protein [Lentisalinibacter salinarum]|uniref:hypothetical protein n=1 Tax=Lentisalinibacter salinarum TaxID=2992239 RepID=UPI00386CB8B9